jgi:hypothetical protein
MARRRAAQGAYHYRPRTAASAFRKKAAPRPTSKAGKRQARTAAYRGGKLPQPGSKAASRRLSRFTPATEEARWLAKAARDVTLSPTRRGERYENPYVDELRQLQEREYRKAYNRQQRETRAAKPKAKPTRVRVKAHWRRRPGR